MTIAAPPDAIWPWLVLMGGDRGGSYSWDLLDHGSRPSAEEVNLAWQQLDPGDRLSLTSIHLGDLAKWD